MTYTKVTQDVLAAMLKTLDRNDPRNYGTVMGLSPGSACITNGFGLLRYQAEDLTVNGVIDQNWQPSSVKFPDYEQVIPKGHRTLVDGETILFLAKHWRRPVGVKDGHLKGLIYLGSTGVYLTSQPADRRGYNPLLIAQYARHLPKFCKLVSAATADDGDVLFLHFDPSILLMVCAVHPPKETK